MMPLVYIFLFLIGVKFAIYKTIKLISNFFRFFDILILLFLIIGFTKNNFFILKYIIQQKEMHLASLFLTKIYIKLCI